MCVCVRARVCVCVWMCVGMCEIVRSQALDNSIAETTGLVRVRVSMCACQHVWCMSYCVCMRVCMSTKHFFDFSECTCTLRMGC